MSGGQRGRRQAVQTGGRAGRRRCRDAARQEVGVAGRHFYQAVPHGLAVRIPGFHPGGPGSTPGVGREVSFWGAGNGDGGGGVLPFRPVRDSFGQNVLARPS